MRHNTPNVLLFLALAVFAHGCGRAAEPYAIPFTLETPGQVSLAVYDQTGRLLRTLLMGARYEPGPHTVTWDGLDRAGRAVPPGAYTWKLLQTPGFQAEYLLTIGSSSPSAPYDPWVGNHAGPSAVHVDDAGMLYVGAACSENVPVMLKQSLDGARRLWAKFRPNIIDDRWVGPMAMGSGQGRLFLLTLGSDAWPSYKIWTLDAETGERARDNQGVFSALWPGAKAGDEKQPQYRPDDMAGREAFCVISYPAQNALRWLEIPTGKELRRVSLPRPTGVAVGPDDTVYVITDGQIARVKPGETAPTIIIPTGKLTNPHRLVIDRTTQELLITDGAPHPNRVSRFTLDGVRKAVYGREGGRQFGAYVAEDFFRITDLVDDGQGGFLITEDGAQTLRRTAHFDRAGRLRHDWFGGQRWGSAITFDPEDPTVISFYGGMGIRAFAKADFAKRTWRVTHVFQEPDTGDLFPSLTEHEALWRLTRRHGKLYLVNDGGRSAASAPAIYRVDFTNNRLWPIARAGAIALKNPPAWWVAAMAQAGHAWDPNARFLPDAYRGYVWTDRNGDGQVQPAEFTLHPAVGMASNHLHIDADWHVIYAVQPEGEAGATYYQLKNEAPEAELPVWHWQRATRVPVERPDELIQNQHARATALYRDANGSLYALLQGETHPDDDRQGSVWPAVTGGMVRVVKWEADGRLAWRVGKHGNDDQLLPGEFQDPVRILGEAHDCLVTQDRVIRPAMVWTKDGLYAGFFGDRHVHDGLPEWVYAFDARAHQPGICLFDNIGGVMIQSPHGEVLWSPNGRDGSPVYRVHGWEGWVRQQGALTVQRAAVAAKATGAGLTGTYFAGDVCEGKALLTRTDARLWFGMRWFPSIASPRPPRPWVAKGTPAPFDLQHFAVRWTGRLEPRFTESYRFFIEHAAKNQVRLWIGGRLVIDGWRKEAPAQAGRRPTREATGGVQLASEPIALTAGTPVAISLEYAVNGGEAALHLSWESRSQERQHVPASALYPVEQP
jgi:hypothetical protein